MPQENKERYTPGGWKFSHIGGHAWNISAPARQDKLVAMVCSTEFDARLIAEAPNMFTLLKEYLRDHDLEEGSEQGCQCFECIAVRRIIVRVFGEELQPGQQPRCQAVMRKMLYDGPGGILFVDCKELALPGKRYCQKHQPRAEPYKPQGMEYK
jgi:hypothetical protein